MAARVGVALANFNPIWFLPVVRLVLAFLVLWLAAPRNATCAPKEIRPPPMGDTINVQVMRGDSAIVTLKAYEGRGNPLEYKITSEPRHGRLVDFRQADGNRQGFASVTYMHDNDEESLDDEFAFRAKASVGGGVSSPIKVKVRIVDAPPLLQVTPVVDFSAVAGESDRQQIILANEGGGSVSGRIAPKEPFRVEGGGRFVLGRGQMTNLFVVFSPQSAENVAPQKFVPSPQSPGATITLRGEAGAPFLASAGTIRTEPDGARRGTITISNLSSSPREVDLTMEPGDVAKLASRVEIPGQGTTELPLTIGPDKAGEAGQIRVVLSNRFHRQDVTIALPPVPPRLQIATKALDFRTSNEAVLTVANSGGTEGRVLLELELSGNIKPVEGAQNFAVAPGAKREILLRHERKQGTQDPVSLTVDLGKAGKVPVPLLFAPAEPSPSPTPTPTPPDSSPVSKAMPWELNHDVKLETVEEKCFIVWPQSKTGFTEAVLENVTVEGSDIDESVQREGWWDALKSYWRSDGGQRAKETGTTLPRSDQGAWLRAEIQEPEARDRSQSWRITAKEEGVTTRKPASVDFEVDWQARMLVPVRTEPAGQREDPRQGAETKEPEAEPVAESPAPHAIAQPARKIETVNVVAGKTRATVTLAIAQDPRITGFLLQRGKIAAPANPEGRTATIPRFVPVPHDGKAAIVSTEAGEQDGKKSTLVVADIEGLQPGTASLWRLVPIAGEEKLEPTDAFAIATPPPQPFPWRGFFLWALPAILVVVLWLRHKRRRADLL